MNNPFNVSGLHQKIFILGSTGFIGFALVRKLIELGFTNIHCLYRDDIKKEKLFQSINCSALTFLKSDIIELEMIRKGIEGASIIVNAAGIATDWGKKKKFWQVNVESPKSIIAMIGEQRKPVQYIHITSASVYGFGNETKTEESPLIRSDPFYTGSKIEIHKWLRQYIAIPHQSHITILAPSIVWGAGDQIYISEIKKRLKQRILCYFGKDESINFVHIDDLINAIILTFSNPKAFNQEYIIDGFQPFTWKEYINIIAKYSGLPPPLFNVPVGVMLIVAGIAESFTKIINLLFPNYKPFLTRLQVLLLSTPFKLSIKKAKIELGYKPEIDFKKGLKGVKEYIEQC